MTSARLAASTPPAPTASARAPTCGATSGNVLDPRELKTEQIVEALEEEDYSNIKIFERQEDYGNHRAVADKDDETFLLEVQPITGDVVEERAETEQDAS